MEKIECKVGKLKTSTSYSIFIKTSSLEGWSTKAKETPSPHKVRWPRWTPIQRMKIRRTNHLNGKKNLVNCVVIFALFFETSQGSNQLFRFASRKTVWKKFTYQVTGHNDLDWGTENFDLKFSHALDFFQKWNFQM